MAHLNPSVAILIGAALDSESQRITEMRERNLYYDGAHPDQLKTQKGKTNDNLVVNLCKVLIEKSVDFLIGDGIIAFKVLLPSGEVDEAKTRWAADWVEAKGGDSFLRELAKSAGIAGTGYIKLRGPEESEDGLPDAFSLDPLELKVIYDDDDIRKVLEYQILYVVAVIPQTGKPGVKRQRVFRKDEGWFVEDSYARDISFDPVGNPFFMIQPNTQWVVSRPATLWPHKWAPIVHWKNLSRPHEFYGESDLTRDVLRIQDAINRNLSNIQRILRFYAHPTTVIEGARFQDAQVGPDRLIELASGKVYNVEMKSELVAAFQFQDRLERKFWSVARVVDPDAVQDLKGERVTNYRVEMLFHPMLTKSQEKWKLMKRALEAVVSRALELADQGVGLKVVAERASPLPVDEAELRLMYQTDVKAGIVSRETAATRLGYVWGDELPRILAERDLFAPAVSPEDEADSGTSEENQS